MTQVVQIPPSHIGAVLQAVGPLLLPGMAASGVDLQEACDDLVDSKAQLWTVIRDEAFIAAFMTSICEDEETPFICVYALGGRGLLGWAKEIDAEMARFAQSQGATRVRFAGAGGWSRVLPAYQITGAHSSGHNVYERAV